MAEKLGWSNTSSVAKVLGPRPEWAGQASVIAAGARRCRTAAAAIAASPCSPIETPLAVWMSNSPTILLQFGENIIATVAEVAHLEKNNEFMKYIKNSDFCTAPDIEGHYGGQRSLSLV